MKPLRVLKQVRDALAHLNPAEVREEARRPFTIQLFARTPEAYEELETWLAPAELSESRRSEVQSVVHRGADYSDGTVIRIFDEGMSHTPADFEFQRGRPEQVVCDIIERHPEIRLSLARQLRPFREPVVKNIVRDISKENALFSIATALPDVVPLLSMPWAIGEFASDTAFLTGNQVRMAFMLAAASDRTVGYRKQRAEIASLFAGAFGWRAIARELVSKVPFGAGVVPKAAIAFAATYVVGTSLERYYRIGYGYSATERKDAYQQALERGKEVAAALMKTISPGKA
jgi:hypothetical protein